MSQGLHILVVNVFFAPNTYGGATHVAEQVSRQIIKRHNGRVTAISAMSRPEFSPYSIMKAESRGIVNYLINLPKGRSPQEIYDNRHVRELVAEIVTATSPNLAHVHCVQEIGAGVVPMLKGMGIPTILSVHDFWWLCERQFMIRPDGRYCGQDPICVEKCKGCVPDLPATRMRNAFLSEQAEAADLVTYPSSFARDLSERSGFARSKGVVWANGTIPPGPEFVALQTARRAADPRIAFGFVGGPSAIKGWPIIQDAFRDLERSDLKGYLVDASLDGSWYAPEQYVGMKGDWSVHERYNSETIDAFYAKIDVLLFLSQWKETFGLTIREALSRGVLVVQTDGGGTVEHFGGDHVRMLKIGDNSDRLRAEIEMILSQPDVTRLQPLQVASYADQADAFIELARPLLPGSSAAC